MPAMRRRLRARDDGPRSDRRWTPARVHVRDGFGRRRRTLPADLSPVPPGVVRARAGRVVGAGSGWKTRRRFSPSEGGRCRAPRTL